MATYNVNLQNPTAYGTAPTGLGALLNNVINLFTLASGVLLFLYLVFGGFKFITAGGDEKAVTSAKNTMTHAVIGLVIVVSAYFITQILGKVLGFPNIFELNFG